MTIQAEANNLCRRFTSSQSRTLAKRLANETGCGLNAARNAIRRARGAHGEAPRHRAVVEREKGTSGWKPKLPPSMAESWEPFDLGTQERIGVISDLHVPYHSEVAVEAAVKWLQKKRITTLLINGDFGDWYSISRFSKKPTLSNKKHDLTSQRDALTWLRSKFKKARIIFKKGNHDERWDHWLWNFAGELCDEEELQLETWLKLEKLGIECVGDQRPVMAGTLPILHGHELPKGITNPVGPARGAFLRTNHTILVGHSHRTSGHADSDMWHDETFCWSTGCLCGLHPAYAVVNKWNWGFAFVTVAQDRTFDVVNTRISKNGDVRTS